MQPDTVTELTILPATRNDLEQILEFRRGMLRDMKRGNEEEVEAAVAELRPWLYERLGGDGILHAPIGSVDGVPVACAIVWIYDWYPGVKRSYVFNVYTHPDWRRRGFAGQLVKECVEWCRGKGVKQVRLHAGEYGRSVYASVGFGSPTYPEMMLRL